MKTDDAHIPLSVHYDPYEKTHGQPLPNLFARRVGTRHEGGGYGSGSSLSGLLPERLNDGLVGRLLGNCMHVPAEQVHVWLQHIRQFTTIVSLDQHESGSTAR
jgi:hypothetical protein